MSITEKTQHLQQWAYSIIIFIGIGYLLYIGSSLIIPLIFAALLAVFLYPINNWLSKYIKWNSVSIVLSYLFVLIPLLLITILFSYQLATIFEALPQINESLQAGVDKLINSLNNIIPVLNLDSKELLSGGVAKADLKEPLRFIGQGLISTTSFFTSLGLTILYTFFLLYYKESIKNFIVYQFEKSARPDIQETLLNMKKSIQSYIVGLGIVVVILSTMNSIGLSLIGIKYAIFWGCLAGMLAIIPYVGTIVGGLLPFLFALSSADAQWQPFAVLGYYMIIQQIEGNFITPKIVGENVDINPLFAILALVFFGSFWGISGVILALPLISIIKILLSNFESTLPYSVLMSSGISKKYGVFRKIANTKS